MIFRKQYDLDEEDEGDKGNLKQRTWQIFIGFFLLPILRSSYTVLFSFYQRHIWAEIQALKVHKGTNYFLVAQNECSWNLLSCYASLAAKLLGKWRRNLAAAWHLLRPDSIRISWQSIAATDMFVSKCAFGMLTNWRTNRTTFSLFLKKE